MTAIASLIMFAGAMGLFGIYMLYFWQWISVCISMIPGLLFLTFIFPKSHWAHTLGIHGLRVWLMIIMIWYGSAAILAELLIFLHPVVPGPTENPDLPMTCRILIHIGWLSFIEIVRIYRWLGKQRENQESGTGANINDH